MTAASEHEDEGEDTDVRVHTEACCLTRWRQIKDCSITAVQGTGLMLYSGTVDAEDCIIEAQCYAICAKRAKVPVSRFEAFSCTLDWEVTR